MATILVSFIGRGQTPRPLEGQTPPPKSRIGYERLCYSFDNGEHVSPPISLFGAALLERLSLQGPAPTTWLVMGTAQSAWTELLEAVPSEQHDYIVGAYDQVGAASKQNSITQEVLTSWQQTVNAYIGHTKVCCRLVGEMVETESQHRAWKALLECVNEGDRVVLDITNSLRNQPVIASFMLMALRWVRGIKDVDFYYGARDLQKQGETCCPVIRLAIVPELMRAAEAAATFRHTGSYLPLTTHLPLTETQQQQALQVALSEETNQITPRIQNAAMSLRNGLKKLPLSPVDAALLPLLVESLEWVAGENLGQQMARKARFAFQSGQYFKALLLLREAILTAGALRYALGDPLFFETREQAEGVLSNQLPFDDKNLLNDLRITRNAMAHGTPARQAQHQQALYSLADVCNLFERGYKLLEQLLIPLPPVIQAAKEVEVQPTEMEEA